MTAILDFIRRAVLLVAAIYGAVITVPVLVHGQASYRLDSMQVEIEKLSVLPERMARLETKMEDLKATMEGEKSLQTGILIAVVPLLLDRLIGAFLKRAKSQPYQS